MGKYTHGLHCKSGMKC